MSTESFSFRFDYAKFTDRIGYTNRQVVGYLRGKRRDDNWPCASNVINTVSNTALKVMETHTHLFTFGLICVLQKKKKKILLQIKVDLLQKWIDPKTLHTN